MVLSFSYNFAFNLKSLFNLNIPLDGRKMYQLEGRCPERRSHLALEHYRTVRNADRFDSGGLLPTNGPAWEKMRKQFQVRVQCAF